MNGGEARLSLSEGGIREPLRARLLTRVVTHAPPSSGTASAVLVPLFARDGEVRLWFVRRAATLRKHSGQVAFPGGKNDAQDASMLATALREAEEEIALPRASVDVLGRLDDLVTGTGFTISPFVAWITEPFTPEPNPSEVARVFDAPLEAFFEKARGIPPFHGHTIDGELVWGATAKIMRDLVAVLRELGAPSDAAALTS
jgi:8-oxo-dGTP pyrophosphatase MutT (NUDIX family)